MKVPKFKNVNEEGKFWDTHESTDYLDDFGNWPRLVLEGYLKSWEWLPILVNRRMPSSMQ